MFGVYGIGVKNMKQNKCRDCGTDKNIKYYVIADDIENHKPYCEKCILKLRMDILELLSKNEKEWK